MEKHWIWVEAVSYTHLDVSKRQELRVTIEKLTAEMKSAAHILEFEHAAYLRDKIKKLKEQYTANPNLKIMKEADEKNKSGKRSRK